MNLKALHDLQKKITDDLEQKLLEMEEIDSEKADEMRKTLALAKEGKLALEDLPNIIKKWQ